VKNDPSGRCRLHFFLQRHAKFAASSVLPLPLYSACCGYGQSGRVRGAAGAAGGAAAALRAIN
jgi:hypothetical protein